MSVTIEIKAASRRVIATVPSGVRWAAFETAVLAAVNRAPVLTDWNWLIDDQGPMEDVDVEGMARIGEAFRARTSQPPRPLYTVVVTTDRFFATWARVIDLNYGGRKHHSAPTKAAAAALLDRLEGGAPAPTGGLS